MPLIIRRPKSRPNLPRQDGADFVGVSYAHFATQMRSTQMRCVLYQLKPYTPRDWQRFRLWCRRRDVSRWVNDFLCEGQGLTYFVTLEFGRGIAEEAVKRKAARLLRRVSGYRREYLVGSWVRLVEPSDGGGWHVHLLLRLVGRQRDWERWRLGQELERGRAKYGFSSPDIRPVRRIKGMTWYFAKCFRVGVQRAHGQPVTFSHDVEKRRYWQKRT